MPRQSLFVHGSAVVMKYPGGKGDPIGSPHTSGHQMNGVLEGRTRIEWSDIVGLRDVMGVTFRGRDSQTNTFLVAVPTPVYRYEPPDTRTAVRAKLARVAVNFHADPGVTIQRISVFDGARPIAFPFPPMALGGNRSSTWDPNVNYFDHPAPIDGLPQISSCVGVGFDVLFANEGNIQFNVVGCDFIV